MLSFILCRLDSSLDLMPAFMIAVLPALSKCVLSPYSQGRHSQAYDVDNALASSMLKGPIIAYLICIFLYWSNIKKVLPAGSYLYLK